MEGVRVRIPALVFSFRVLGLGFSFYKKKQLRGVWGGVAPHLGNTSKMTKQLPRCHGDPMGHPDG